MQADFEHIKQRVASHAPVRIIDSSSRYACVLVSLVSHEQSLHLLLTKRTDRVEHHKGQISFPGGVVDESDKSPEHTALRELEEELGIPSSSVTIIGQLDDFHIPTGFIVTPLVGFINHPIDVHMKNDEVDEILLIPLSKFFDPSLRRTEIRFLKGEDRQVYVYDVWKEPVWGATAHIIKQFTDLLA
ncbi:MAG: CoA pyrophosphatase [Bacteroidota bacterium]